jgi:hypothetical protein
MATQELTSRGWSWLNDWRLPFLWITLTPIVTVPLSAILYSALAGRQTPAEIGVPDPARTDGCDGWFCATYEYSEVGPTVLAFALPGLLNLVSFLWVSSTRPRVRAAGIVAGLLGVLRFSIPVIVLTAAFDRVTDAGGTTYFQFSGWINLSPHAEVWSAGFFAWLGSLSVWAVFRVLTRSPERADIASVFLGAVGVLCLGRGLTTLTTPGLLYVGLGFAILGAGALGFAVLGLMPVRSKETRRVP